MNHSDKRSLTAERPRLQLPTLEWRELLQGTIVSGTTGLALVPLLQSAFGLEFSEAVTCSIIHSLLLCTSFLFFGINLAPGWITPVLPLVLAFVLGTYDSPTERFQAMTALSINFFVLTFFLGITGLGQKLFNWMPRALKGGIVIGAAMAAFKRVFLDDIETFLAAPVATSVALVVCFLLLFSQPVLRFREKYKIIDGLANLGLLPCLIFAGVVGWWLGELQFTISWGFFAPEFSSLWEKSSPYYIGWPTLDMYMQGIPLSLVAYTMLFGDIVTGDEITKSAQHTRPDNQIQLNLKRVHTSVAARNLLMAVSAPFFSSQGVLWAGVQVVVVQRWKRGSDKMASLMSGIGSYYIGAPLVFFLLPALSLLTPLMDIALSMTLVITGYACAYVAMEIPKNATERGVVFVTGMAMVLFEPWLALSIGLAMNVLLVSSEAGNLGSE